MVLEPDPSDSRARIIRLTRRGRALHELAVDVHAQLEAEWAASVGKRRYAELRKTLAEVTNGVRARL